MKSFNMSKIVDVIELKWLYSFMFKVWGQKCINVSDKDESQIHVKVQGLQMFLVRLRQKVKAKNLIVLKYTTNVFILSLK